MSTTKRKVLQNQRRREFARAVDRVMCCRSKRSNVAGGMFRTKFEQVVHPRLVFKLTSRRNQSFPFMRHCRLTIIRMVRKARSWPYV